MWFSKKDSYFALYLSIVLYIWASSALALQKVKNKTENVNLTVIITGDLQGKWNLSGPVNSKLEGSPDSEISTPCSLSSFVRKAQQSSVMGLEIWPRLRCTFEGQISDIRLHKFFVEIKQESQKKVYRAVTLKVQNLYLNIESVSLLKSNK